MAYEQTVVCSECQTRVSIQDAEFLDNEEMGVCGFTCTKCIEEDDKRYTSNDDDIYRDWELEYGS